jgi:predicted HTH transcriptional regulator
VSYIRWLESYAVAARQTGLSVSEFDLAERLGVMERPNLEFKQAASDRDALRRAIGALSNDLGNDGVGHLLIGVDDQGDEDR